MTSTPSPEEALEQTLWSFMAALAPDLGQLQELAPKFVSLFAETALTLIALEHVLCKKGLLDRGDLSAALEEAQNTVLRLRSRPGILTAGSA